MQNLNQTMMYRYGYMAMKRRKRERILAGALVVMAGLTFILAAAVYPAAIA